jgi:hypothetical protein
MVYHTSLIKVCLLSLILLPFMASAHSHRHKNEDIKDADEYLTLQHELQEQIEFYQGLVEKLDQLIFKRDNLDR